MAPTGIMPVMAELDEAEPPADVLSESPIPPELKEPDITFNAKREAKKEERSKKHLKKKMAIKIKAVRPRSPLIFKDGKKKSRNPTNHLLSPKKRAIRKKISFESKVCPPTVGEGRMVFTNESSH